jgi:NADP-dependent 3-hydroxy acid dehydrogenase YdfG
MPTAFITGPAGGLGTALAEALAPTHTLFLGGRPSDRLDALA